MSKTSRTKTTPPAPRQPLSPMHYWLGMVFLAVAATASWVLAADHLHLFKPPGCGDGSPCDLAARSAFGTVPLVGWSTSFVGMAYFLSLAASWTVARRSAAGQVPAAFRNLVRVGAGLSVMFLVAMIAGGYACLYCIAAHAGNFLFLVVMETVPRAPETAGAPIATRRLVGWGLGAFAVVTALEIGLDAYAGSRQKEILDTSIKQITDTSRQQAEESRGEPFTGRYLAGPARAPIRLVIISDYQCPDCRTIEAEVRQITSRRSDVSVSAKHYPFCMACNSHVGKTLHPNACWAARAAESAGILYGNDGFWRMHYWLFDRKGGFTDAELHAVLAEWGYDRAEFTQLMQSDRTVELVKKDIEQAVELGLYTTPMIFINGVELRGWLVPNALTKAVEALAATNPPAGDATQDRPPAADEKYIDDWREQPTLPMPPDAREWSIGPRDAAVEVVNWGDYQEPHTAKADAKLRAMVASRGDTSYTFRHYPINKPCNPATPVNFHPLACRAAQAAEAAGALGGNDAYWAMHVWLMTNLETFSDETLAQAARDMGLDPQALFAEMESTEVAREIARDATLGARLGLRAVPFIFVNGRHLARWNKPGILDAVLGEASR